MYKPDNKVFEERREIFLEKLGGKAAIIPGANLVKHHADCEYPFRQDSNFWYLTGFDEPDAVALSYRISQRERDLFCLLLLKMLLAKFGMALDGV